MSAFADVLESGGNAGSIETSDHFGDGTKHITSWNLAETPARLKPHTTHTHTHTHTLESGGNAGSIETLLDYYSLLWSTVGIWRKRRLDWNSVCVYHFYTLFGWNLAETPARLKLVGFFVKGIGILGWNLAETPARLKRILNVTD